MQNQAISSSSVQVVSTPEKKSYFQSLKKSAQRGFSNVQIAIGILVGVIILLGSLGGYQYIVQAKVNNEISLITDLRSATVRYGQFTGVFNSTNVTEAILTGLNFFPNGQPVNSFGGTIVPAVGTINTAGDSIQFTFNGISTYACKQIGTMLDNVVSIVSINGTTTKAAGASSLPLSVGTACTAGDGNVLVYTISR